MLKKLLLTTCLALFGLSVASSAYATSRVAVVYYSKSGINTKSVADAVKHFTNADLYRIEVEEPYPEEYTATTEVVKKEIENGIFRPIKKLDINLNNYDAIVIASPTWWHHIAGPVETWIRSVDLKGKQVLPATTHGGGGIMETNKDFQRLLPQSKLGTQLVIFGRVDEDSSEVHDWLVQNKVAD